MAVVDLTARRLERPEKRQQQTNEQLGRIVDVLEVHSQHFERVEDALIGIAERVDNMAARMDRLATAIAADARKISFDWTITSADCGRSSVATVAASGADRSCNPTLLGSRPGLTGGFCADRGMGPAACRLFDSFDVCFV
jgi:hypothetical protein